MNGQRISPAVATAFSSAAYGALLVCVTGFVSLWTDSPVLGSAHISVVPAMLAGVVAVLAFAWALLRSLREARPTYPAAVLVALASGLAHIVSLWLLAVAFGEGAVAATAAVGASVTGWASLSFVLVAAVCAWSGVALRRTRADRPRWPWERRDDE